MGSVPDPFTRSGARRKATSFYQMEVCFILMTLGGDQLSVARAQGAQAMRASHDSFLERLEGIIPVVEDWHSRMTLKRVR